MALAVTMSKQLESLLRDSGLASDLQLRRVQERVEQGGGSFIEILVKEERVPEEAIADAFTERLRVPRVRVAAFLLDEEALRKVPERLARKHQCLPLGTEGRMLMVAMVDPIDYRAIQDIEFAAASTVKPVAASLSEVLEGIDERYGAEDRIGAFLANVPDAPDIQILSEDNADLSMDDRRLGGGGRGGAGRQDVQPRDLRRAEESRRATCTSSRRCTTCRCACAWTACCATTRACRSGCTARWCRA